MVPRDGIWLDDTWHYGGSEATVHNRNLTLNRSVTMHIGDGMTAIIVEGEAHFGKAGPSIAQGLADEQNRKYSHYGMKATPERYTAWSPGVFVLLACLPGRISRSTSQNSRSHRGEPSMRPGVGKMSSLTEQNVAGPSGSGRSSAHLLQGVTL